MTLPRRAILACGVQFHSEVPAYFRQIWGTPEEIGGKIKADLARAHEAGFDVTSYQVHVDRLAEGLRGLEDKLKEQDWDAVMVGAGVRLVPEFSAIFEALVNVCRKHVPANVPFLFNDGPSGHCDALGRGFGGFGADT